LFAYRTTMYRYWNNCRERSWVVCKKEEPEEEPAADDKRPIQLFDDTSVGRTPPIPKGMYINIYIYIYIYIYILNVCITPTNRCSY